MLGTDILIENGTIVTMDPDRRVLRDSSVAVTGGKIVDIGPADELRARHRPAKVIDARRKAIMPGLIDLHAHSGRNLIKNVGEHLPSGYWRNVAEFVNYHSSPEWHYVESLLSSLEKMKGGTTCSLYMGGLAIKGTDIQCALKNLEGVERVGIRSVVAFGPYRPPWPREVSEVQNGKRVLRWVSLEDQFEGTSELIRLWQARKSPLVDVWVMVSRLLNPNPADPVYNPDNAKHSRPQMEGIRRIMDQYGVGLHFHAYGTAIRFAYESGFDLLGSKTVIGHGWPLDMDAVEILARTDTRVAHCPRTRRIYWVKGRCPIPELIDAGVIVGLGSDACGLDNPFDSLWEDIFLAPRWQRRELNDSTVIPPGKALEMATIDGARALNMQDRIGSIEIGKDADIIVVDLFKPHIVPIFMEPTRLAHYVRGSDVDTVIVRGQVLMENRQVKSVDETEVLEWAQQEGERTIRTFGLEPLMEPSERYWRCSHD